MRANAWRKYLEEQRERYGKVLFTLTELANVAGVSPAMSNKESKRAPNSALQKKAPRKPSAPEA